MTVSNVVNGRGGASKETRRRVLEVVKRMGYVRNPARGRNGRPGMFGVLTLDLTGQYALEIVRAIADELAEAEFEPLISPSYQDPPPDLHQLPYLPAGL